MKRYAVLFVALMLLIAVPPVSAAKPRVRSVPKSGGGGGGVAAASYSRAKLSRATRSVVVTFLNLANVSSVTYTLSYTANGISQGAVGTITPAGDTDTRDLYFGTCSHGVCTPHYGIKNAVLLIETQLKNGRTNSKRYRIRM